MNNRTHIYPLNDTREHATDGSPCWCEPQEAEPGLIVHNSADGRETKEQLKAGDWTLKGPHPQFVTEVVKDKKPKQSLIGRAFDRAQLNIKLGWLKPKTKNK